MFRPKRCRLYILMTFVCIFAAGVYSTYLTVSANRNEQQLLMIEMSSAQVSAIERRLSHSLSTTYILAQEVRRSNGQFKDFDHFAEEVMQTLGGVSSLQLAPKGVATIVYPLAGNEISIGHHILESDDRRNEALNSIKTKTLTLAGPFMLRQGRVGMIGRNPIFLKNNDGGEYFWGFAMAVIYLDDLLASTKFEQLAQKGYAFQLARIHPDTGKEDIFSHSGRPLDEFQVEKNIKVPNGQWSLTISRPSNFRWQLAIGLMLSLSMASMLSLLVRRILLEPERLRELVKKQTLQLEQLAFKDELTGLDNRRSFTEQLNRALLRLSRHDHSLALMYLDLDDFKQVNDVNGHEGGDKLLITVAQRLKALVREVDIVARIGGDEFALLLLDIKNSQNAQLIAEKIIASISVPIQVAQTQARVGISIGITLAPQDGLSSEELLHNADLAMYQSKEAGKNIFTFYKPEK